VGTQGGDIDFALLVDGLAAEREQGITIDVAYRFFATERRKFIVADTPGHEQYTRNMATGASTADLAIILIDARKGVLTQTRRHSFLVHLLGIRHIVLAVNKMDLVGHEQARFDEIVADYAEVAREIGVAGFTAIPMSAKLGDNVVIQGPNMAWYQGPALLEHLEGVAVGGPSAGIAPFCMAVQWVNRPDQDFRGYAGTIASGRVRPGDSVTILPSGRTTRIARIVTADGDLDEAGTDQAVTLTFADQVDCSRGDLVAAAGGANVADAIDASLVWMGEAAMVPTRPYWLKLGTQLVSARIARVDAVVDVNALEDRRGFTLRLNDVGRVRIDLDRPIAALPYAESRALGGFILIDKATNATVAAGMIGSFPETAAAAQIHADRIYWAAGTDEEDRAARASRLQARLGLGGRSAFVLGEAEMREGIGRDLGGDATAMARRAGDVARLMSRAGVTIILAVPVPDGFSVPGSIVGPEADNARPVEDWII
jgi:bifunctional enzyme CysN/CysC